MAIETLPTGVEKDEGKETKPEVQEKARLVRPKSDGDVKVNADIDDLFEKAWKARSLYDAWWTRYVAFVENQQYLRSTRYGSLVPDNRVPTGKTRITVNLMKPTLQQMVSIMTTEKPQLTAAPASQDSKDKNRADCSTQVLKKLQQPSWLDFPGKDRLQKRWKAITGTCAIVPEWNPDAGPVVKKIVPNPVTGEPQAALDDKGNTIWEHTGALELPFFTSFEIYPDPGCSSEQDAEFVFLVTSMDPEEAKRRYGVSVSAKDTGGRERKKGSDANEGGPSRVSALLARVYSMFGAAGGYLSQWGAVSNRGVDVLRLYIAPSVNEPSGRYILRVGDKIVHDEPSEMRGEFRFDPVFFRHEENGKRFFGNGVMELVIDLQIELNNAISQMAQQRKLNLNPKILVDDRCQIQEEDYLSSEGSVLRFNGFADAQPPKPIQMPGIEPALFQILQLYQDMFDRIVGLNEPSRGEAVPKLTGKAIQLLQEANRSRLGTVVTQDYERWADVAERVLFLVGKHLEPDALKELAGSNYASMEEDFYTSVLSEPVDIVVENDNALPQDRAQRFSLIAQMAGAGGPLTLEEPLRTQVFKLLKYADVSGLLEEENLDDLRVRRMYQDIVKTGRPQMPAEYDNPVKCRYSLEVLMKNQEFEELAAKEPNKAALVVQLYRLYAQRLSGVPMPGPGGGQMPPGVVPPQDMVQKQMQAATVPEPKGSPPAAKQPTP